MVEGLIAAFADEDDDTAVVVLAGNGSFCSGLDLSLSDGERAEVSDRLYELYALMVRSPRPIVAAAEGHAIGAGAQLLVASDLRLVSPHCEIRFPGPEHGLAVGAWALPSLIGRGRAIDLCLTMRPVRAEEALQIGLVDRVEERLDDAALVLAAEIAALDRVAVERVKALAVEASGHEQVLAHEADGNRGRIPSAVRKKAAARESERARWR